MKDKEKRGKNHCAQYQSCVAIEMQAVCTHWLVLCVAGLWTPSLSHYEISRMLVNWTRVEPKYWPSYVDRFLASIFTDASSESGLHADSLAFCMKVSKAFYQFSLLHQKPHDFVKSPTYCSHPGKPIVSVWHTKSQDIHHGVLKRPTGHAEFYRPPHCPKIGNFYKDPESTAKAPHWRWQIYLHPMLRLNITFQFIYFSAVKYCATAHLRLTGIEMQPFCKMPVNSKIEKMADFVFCGIHSQISVFSWWSCIDLGLYAYMFVVYDIFFAYTIIDKNSKVALIHRPQSIQHQQIALTQATSIKSSSLPLCIFHVITRKTHMIHVQISSTVSEKVISLNDGPGSQSKPPELIQHSLDLKEYLTATFQCVLYLWCQGGSVENNNISVVFTKHRAPQKLSLNQNDKKAIIFHRTFGESPVTYMQIKTDPGFSVNVSVSHITYSGKINTMDCMFGGVSVYQGLKEVSTLCIKTNGISEERSSGLPVRDEYVFPNIYSASHQLELVIFSYPEYVSMMTNLTVSTTRCRSVEIEMTNKSKTTIVSSQHPPFQEKPKFFHLKQNACLVITLETNKRINSLNPRHDLLYWLRIAVIHIKNVAHLVTFRTTSFFRGIFTLYCTSILTKLSTKVRNKLNQQT